MSRRPLVIKLVRHGESMANVRAVDPNVVGDFTVALTPKGHSQAQEVGRKIGADFLRNAMLYCSPYRRTRETMAGVIEGAGVPADELRVFEDPRLREVEHGYRDLAAQAELRQTHGLFFYRFQGGESPADCFDRTSGFLDTLMRQVERLKAETVLVVTHGMTIRCFVMRFLHLSVEDFDRIENPNNCDVITLGPKDRMDNPVFTFEGWGLEGLRTLAN